MNEQFKLLAEQAGLPFHNGFMWSELDSDEKTEFLKQFAELIIQECASLAQDAADNDENIVTVLNQHFGVKRQWVGLTRNEILSIVNEFYKIHASEREIAFARFVITRFKEKNT